MKAAKTIISTLFILSLFIGTTLNFKTNNTAGLQDVLFVSSYAVSNVGVTVGGVEITDANKHNVFGDNTVSFDDTTNTLTLNGANISNSCNGGAITTALPNLNIKLNGSNVIENTKSGENGISAHSLNFTGSGSIKISGGNGKPGNSGSVGENGGDGLYASGDVVVSSSVNISIIGGNGGDGGMSQAGGGDGGSGGDGILVSGKLSAQNGSYFSIEGGSGGVGGSSANGTSGNGGDGGNGITSPDINFSNSTILSFAGDCKNSSNSSVCQAISTKPVLSFSNGSVYVYSGNGAPGNLVNNPIATDYHKQKYVHIDTTEIVFPTPSFPPPVVEQQPSIPLIAPTPTPDQNSNQSFNSYYSYTVPTLPPNEQTSDISDWISSLTPTPEPTSNAEISLNVTYNGFPFVYILPDANYLYLIPPNIGDVPTIIKLNDIVLTQQTIDNDGNAIIPFEVFKNLSSGKHILSVVFDDETYQSEVIVRGNSPISAGKFFIKENIAIPIIAVCSGSVVVIGIITAVVLIIKKRIKR